MDINQSKKKLLFHEAAQLNLLNGVNQLADAVSVTLGPGGLNVVIERPGMVPILTKDGVTVAKAINLPDKMENLGVQLVKEAASGAADVAGDGTTTATILARSLFELGLRAINAGHDSTKIRKGILLGTDKLIDDLVKKSADVTTDNEIIQVGTISANGEEEIGRYLAKAMAAVGRDGIITVEEAKGFKTNLEEVDGTRINRGFISPYFINDKNKNICILENPYVLLVNRKITTLRDILPILEQIHNKSASLLIVAEDVDGEALNGLVVNVTKGTIKTCVIRAPEFGQNRLGAMEDLSILLKTSVFSNESDLGKESIESLGKCKKIIVSKSETIIIKPAGTAECINKRSLLLREAMAVPGLNQSEKLAIQRRLARLSGGIAILRVGGSTEAELRERKDRVEDALHATRAAVASGILPGGGIALLRCSRSINIDTLDQDVLLGVGILKKACQQPIKQIVSNSGKVPEIIIEKLLENENFNYGYNARTEDFGNMKDEGIIDPTLVITSAIRHAVSAAHNLLSVACAIHAIDE